jgi:hypothetical protein
MRTGRTNEMRDWQRCLKTAQRVKIRGEAESESEGQQGQSKTFEHFCSPRRWARPAKIIALIGVLGAFSPPNTALTSSEVGYGRPAFNGRVLERTIRRGATIHGCRDVARCRGPSARLTDYGGSIEGWLSPSCHGGTCRSATRMKDECGRQTGSRRWLPSWRRRGTLPQAVTSPHRGHHRCQQCYHSSLGISSGLC